MPVWMQTMFAVRSNIHSYLPKQTWCPPICLKVGRFNCSSLAIAVASATPKMLWHFCGLERPPASQPASPSARPPSCMPEKLWKCMWLFTSTRFHFSAFWWVFAEMRLIFSNPSPPLQCFDGKSSKCNVFRRKQMLAVNLPHTECGTFSGGKTFSACTRCGLQIIFKWFGMEVAWKGSSRLDVYVQPTHGCNYRLVWLDCDDRNSWPMVERVEIL